MLDILGKIAPEQIVAVVREGFESPNQDGEKSEEEELVNSTMNAKPRGVLARLQ